MYSLCFKEGNVLSPLKAKPKAYAPTPGKKRQHDMLEHAKKLTESANDALHQETDEADTQNVSTQAAETGLDVAHHAKAAVHRLYATQADARRAVKQTEASDFKTDSDETSGSLSHCLKVV